MLTGTGQYRLTRAGRVIAAGKYKNTITPEAKVALVAAAFSGERPGANWYFGLFRYVEGAPNTQSGTMADHPNWEEVDCGPLTRTSLGPMTTLILPDGSGIDYYSEILDITMTSSDLVEGVFLTNREEIEDDTGLLWSKAQVDIPEVTEGDVLSINYRISFTRDSSTLTGAETQGSDVWQVLEG